MWIDLTILVPKSFAPRSRSMIGWSIDQDLKERSIEDPSFFWGLLRIRGQSVVFFFNNLWVRVLGSGFMFLFKTHLDLN